MIKPTIGRVVLVYVPGNVQWIPAQICHVHSDTLINVGGFDATGAPLALSHLPLRQDPVALDPVFVPEDVGTTPFACWMPYQRSAAGV